MDCNEATSLIALYIDAELDAKREAALVAHMRVCAACSVAYSRAGSARHALRAALTRHRPSAEFRERVLQALPGTKETSSLLGNAARIRKSVAYTLARWLGLGARSGLRPLASLVVACLLTAALTYAITVSWDRPPADVAIVTAHVRAIGEGRLTFVGSSDRHTVKPWFAGKLAFAPQVSDLSADAFPLAGGRVETVRAQQAAVLVYLRRQHIIQVFVWPDDSHPAREPERSFERTTRGFSLVSWRHDGLVYTAISDLNPPELALFRDHFTTKSVPSGSRSE
ncbi:MAG: anti-sigma factor family protein [Burkholderiales bacterium]